MKEIIFKYLKRLNINGLATFKSGPAIFLDQAPDDSDSRWAYHLWAESER